MAHRSRKRYIQGWWCQRSLGTCWFVRNMHEETPLRNAETHGPVGPVGPGSPSLRRSCCSPKDSLRLGSAGGARKRKRKRDVWALEGTAQHDPPGRADLQYKTRPAQVHSRRSTPTSNSTLSPRALPIHTPAGLPSRFLSTQCPPPPTTRTTYPSLLLASQICPVNPAAAGSRANDISKPLGLSQTGSAAVRHSTVQDPISSAPAFSHSPPPVLPLTLPLAGHLTSKPDLLPTTSRRRQDTPTHPHPHAHAHAHRHRHRHRHTHTRTRTPSQLRPPRPGEPLASTNC